MRITLAREEWNMVSVYKTLTVWSGGEWEGLASPQSKRMHGSIFRILL